MNTNTGLTAYQQAAEIYEDKSDLLMGAGMLAFFERYKDSGPTRTERIWRVQAVTKVGMSGELVAHPVAQLPREAALQLLDMMHGARMSNVLTRWGDLSPAMQTRVVQSRMLPIEFKTVAMMNKLTLEAEGDFFLLLAPRPVMSLLS